MKNYFLLKKRFKNLTKQSKVGFYHKRHKKKTIKLNHTTLKQQKIFTPIYTLNSNIFLLIDWSGTIIMKELLFNNNFFTNSYINQVLFKYSPLDKSFFHLNSREFLKNIFLNKRNFCKSFNSKGFLLSKSKLKCNIVLPSKQVLVVWVGDNFSYNNINNLRFKNVKHPIVRGIAKNPVDHPNGGNSNIKKPFKTPWSSIAKKGK